ncbi:hypothetical protein CASFOL_009236 [Castilleja foliolosa]|uniref:Rab-GAP TBC domain-containing protein n=1 Tax=Castilleja foliolosa TaxID=1961234 RepID=A0ABD3DX96_9LAMI
MGGKIGVVVKYVVVLVEQAFIEWDTYGFTVRPQYIHQYREYASIYKEEEGERLQKWKSFLEQQAESASVHHSNEDNIKCVVSVLIEQSSNPAQTISCERDDSTQRKPEDPEVTTNKTEPVGKVSNDSGENTREEVATTQYGKPREVQTWAQISPSLSSIEHMMSLRVKKGKNMGHETEHMHNDLPSIDEERPLAEEYEHGDDKDAFDDKEITDSPDVSSVKKTSASDEMSSEPCFPWKEELDFLVHGGVPKDLRGEVWQAFVGVRTRRVENYYQDLLAKESDSGDGKEHDKLLPGDNKTEDKGKKYDLPEKWKKQIEKDLPRTFPGHPALNDKGRNSLRRVLWAYARHNPSVGYCQ